MSEMVMSDQAALELAAPRTVCALKNPVSIPASCRQVLSHLAIVLPVTGSCFPIQERNGDVLPVSAVGFKIAVSSAHMSKLCLLGTHLCPLET